MAKTQMKLPKNVCLASCLAEFVGMALFVMIGCGSAMGIQGSGSSGGSGGDAESSAGEMSSMIPGWVLMVSLSFGLSITALAYSIGHYSGGHINCAVTLGLVLTGNCGLLQGVCNFFSQMLGSVTGAAILCAIFPPQLDMTKTIGANSVGPKWHWWNALVGEIMCTFLLVFVVLQTACNPKSKTNRSQACIAIGLSVFMAHCVMIPIDGCSINPTRSFGPALLALTRMEAPKAVEPAASMVGEPSGAEVVPEAHAMADDNAGPSFWRDMWIFWIGPLLGASLAALVYKAMIMLDLAEKEDADKDREEMPKDEEAAEYPRILGQKQKTSHASESKA